MNVDLISELVNEAKRQGLSKGDLSRRAGLTQPAFSRLIAGRNGARLETVEKLASVLGLRLALVPDDDYAADLVAGRIIDFGTSDRGSD
jgi:predicted transcriptional regulator